MKIKGRGREEEGRRRRRKKKKKEEEEGTGYLVVLDVRQGHKTHQEGDEGTTQTKQGGKHGHSRVRIQS